MKAKITAQLETSDHDGYCSGGVCEYETKITTTIINTPKQYLSHSLGLIDIDDLDEYDWVCHLKEPEINYSGSCYCDLSSTSELNGLDKHDYRYTILKVELFDETNSNNLDMKKIFAD